VTELRNARTRIRDLEVAASSQRAEVARFHQYIILTSVITSIRAA